MLGFNHSSFTAAILFTLRPGLFVLLITLYSGDLNSEHLISSYLCVNQMVYYSDAWYHEDRYSNGGLITGLFTKWWSDY